MTEADDHVARYGGEEFAVILPGLGLEEAGIDYDRLGINVTNALRTTIRRVYAIGDVAGGPQFTHVAGYHAGLVIRGILFRKKAVVDYNIVPWVTYCDPEIAHVGMNEYDAKENLDHIRVLRWPYHDNDRALAVVLRACRSQDNGSHDACQQKAHEFAFHGVTYGVAVGVGVGVGVSSGEPPGGTVLSIGGGGTSGGGGGASGSVIDITSTGTSSSPDPPGTSPSPGSPGTWGD